MSKVIKFPGHKWHSMCRGDDYTHCIICNGGLASCETCKGAEATLPADCPGVPLTEEQRYAISNGTLDYRWREGGWIILKVSKTNPKPSEG